MSSKVDAWNAVTKERIEQKKRRRKKSRSCMIGSKTIM